MKSTTKQFLVQDTNIVKGVAIIILMFHHCFLSASRFEGYDISFFPLTQEMVVSAARAGKCCVGIFTFLSAYGLTRTYQKAERTWRGDSEVKLAEKFVLRRYINLISSFFAVYVVAFICSYLV